MQDDEAREVRARIQRESRLIGRLLQMELPALHSECETIGLPHEGRSPSELRAALFNRLRREKSG